MTNTIKATATEMGKQYMNAETGSIGTYNDWYYEDENGESVNAVNRGEVVEVEYIDGEWVEV